MAAEHNEVLAEEARAYVDLVSTDEAGTRTATLVVEYAGKNVRLVFDLGPTEEHEEPVAEIIRRELPLLIDVLEAIDGSANGILDKKPEPVSSIKTETSGMSSPP